MHVSTINEQARVLQRDENMNVIFYYKQTLCS